MIELANKNGCGTFKRWDLRGSEMEDDKTSVVYIIMYHLGPQLGVWIMRVST